VDDKPEARAKRLFVAVNLSIASTRRVAEAADRLRRAANDRQIKVAWVPPANLHVTLKFLGWTRPEAVAAVRDRLRDGLAGKKGFEIEAASVGAFPNPASARVIWIGVRDGSGALAALAGDVESWMTGLGFERETRPFSPHVTLGRVRDRAGTDCGELLAPWVPLSFGSSLIREVVLYESVTKSNGSEYVALLRAPLDVPPGRTERQTRTVEESGIPGEGEQEEPDTHGGPKRDD
jgi:2'-5' RNA ligase